jgi:hypothetical protein
LIAGNLDNAWVRSEHQRVDAVAKFYQVGLGIDHRFDEVFFLNIFAGTSRSDSGRPHDTTINYDNRDYDGYRFDFTNDETPILAFNGPDVTNPATFVVPELRDIVQSVEGGFDTAEANLNASILDELKLAAGVNFKRATYETKESTTVTPTMTVRTTSSGRQVTPRSRSWSSIGAVPAPARRRAGPRPGSTAGSTPSATTTRP